MKPPRELFREELWLGHSYGYETPSDLIEMPGRLADGNGRVAARWPAYPL